MLCDDRLCDDLLRRRLVLESGYGGLSVDVDVLFEAVFLESHENGLESFFSIFFSICSYLTSGER